MFLPPHPLPFPVVLVQTYELWSGELDYVDMLLEEDLRNNSAWNQRYFVVASTTGFTEQVLAKEVE